MNTRTTNAPIGGAAYTQPQRAAAPAAGVLSALVLAAAMAACSPESSSTAEKPAEPTVGQKIDGAIADAKQTMGEVKEDAKEATSTIATEAKQAADSATEAAADAAITAAVKAKLAADPSLSALRINVDTESGQVAMSGDAPTEAARERASELARSVDGVKAVDNRLTLQPKG